MIAGMLPAMPRYRPRPEIDGGVIDNNEAYVRRWPFFSFEGKRWVYRRYGLGKPVTVSIDEVVAATERLQRTLKPVRWAVGVLVVIGLFWLTKFVENDLLGVFAPALFTAIVGAIYSIVRFVVARLLFARFDNRPRFGKSVTVMSRLDEAFRIKFWGEILAPGSDGALVLLLLAISIFAWLVFDIGFFFVVGGVALGVALTIFFTRWETQRNAEFERLTREREESDALLTEALERRD